MADEREVSGLMGQLLLKHALVSLPADGTPDRLSRSPGHIAKEVAGRTKSHSGLGCGGGGRRQEPRGGLHGALLASHDRRVLRGNVGLRHCGGQLRHAACNRLNSAAGSLRQRLGDGAGGRVDLGLRQHASLRGSGQIAVGRVDRQALRLCLGNPLGRIGIALALLDKALAGRVGMLSAGRVKQLGHKIASEAAAANAGEGAARHASQHPARLHDRAKDVGLIGRAQRLDALRVVLAVGALGGLRDLPASAGQVLGRGLPGLCKQVDGLLRAPGWLPDVGCVEEHALRLADCAESLAGRALYGLKHAASGIGSDTAGERLVWIVLRLLRCCAVRG